MAPDTFARERLGWWSPVVTEKLDYALDKNAWDRCASDDEKPEGKTAYGVKFAADVGGVPVRCGHPEGRPGEGIADRDAAHGARLRLAGRLAECPL